MKNYVMGDLHGSFDSLKKAIDMIDLKNSRLFLIGDYIDRGKQGYDVMKYLIDNYEPDYEKCGIHPILGNHDYTMLYNYSMVTSLGDDINFDELKKISLFDSVFSALFELRCSLDTDDIVKIIKIAYPVMDFIQSLPVVYKVKSGEREFYLSHASLIGNSKEVAENADVYVNKKCDEIGNYELNKIIWDREEYLFRSKIFEDSDNKFSIVGHTPVFAVKEFFWSKYGYEKIMPCNNDEKYLGYPMYNKIKKCINIDTGGIFGILNPYKYKTFYTLFDMDEFKVYAV